MKTILLSTLLVCTSFAEPTTDLTPPVLEVAGPFQTDEESMTHYALIGLLAEFYSQNKAWPERTEEIKSLKVEGISTENIEELLGIFDVIKIQNKKENILVSYWYVSSYRKVERSVLLHPAESNDQIMLKSEIQ